MVKEIHLIPEGRLNHWLDAVELAAGREHVYVFREGQSPEEFWSELEAAEIREQHGLPPGRTMPTAKEIAAGPVTPPPPRDLAAEFDAYKAASEARIESLTTELVNLKTAAAAKTVRTSR